MDDQAVSASLKVIVELDFYYNSFKGKSLDQVSESLHDEIHDLIRENLDDDVVGIYTTFESPQLST
tara:strand:+ start:2365 stop:2562 length:198 start_codon:yes stop_codon:yes gene_type:complete